MIIRPTTALRAELGEITRMCKENAEPVYLTKNGTGELVIMSIEAYERREAMLELRTKLLEAEQQRLSGVKPYTANEVRDYIKELHDASL